MNLRGIVRWNPLDIAIITEETVLLCQSTRRTVLFDLLRLNNNLFAHQFNIPFFIWMVAKVLFAISTQIPLANDFPLSERKFVPLCGTDKGMLTSTKLAVSNLFATLLWLAATPSAYWSSLSTLSHNVRNVMRGRRLSLRHSVKHYEASDPKRFMLRFICIAFMGEEEPVTFSPCVTISDLFIIIIFS